MSVKIKGLNKLNVKVKKLQDTFDIKNVKKASQRPAEIIKSEVERRTPVGPTGNLKRSIVAKEQKYNWIAAVDRKIAPHAHLVEFGTVNMSAKPFFRPGVEQGAGKASKVFQDNLRKNIDKAVR